MVAEGSKTGRTSSPIQACFHPGNSCYEVVCGEQASRCPLLSPLFFNKTILNQLGKQEPHSSQQRWKVCLCSTERGRERETQATLTSNTVTDPSLVSDTVDPTRMYNVQELSNTFSETENSTQIGQRRGTYLEGERNCLGWSGSGEKSTEARECDD